MENDTHERDTRPVPETGDALTAVLRQGARDLLRQAVEAELQAFLDEYAQHKLNDGRQAVVRNGYQPERTVQTGIGEVPVGVPKTRDRSGSGIRFTSNVLPPYLRRSRSVEELLPWLYPRGYRAVTFKRR